MKKLIEKLRLWLISRLNAVPMDEFSQIFREGVHANEMLAAERAESQRNYRIPPGSRALPIRYTRDMPPQRNYILRLVLRRMLHARRKLQGRQLVQKVLAGEGKGRCLSILTAFTAASPRSEISRGRYTARAAAPSGSASISARPHEKSGKSVKEPRLHLTRR